MKILVLGNERAWKELTNENSGIEWIRVENIASFLEPNDATACINLLENAHLEDYSPIKKPLIINSVVKTLHEIKAGKNAIRINGWNGFIHRSTWEVAGEPNESHFEVFKEIQKKMIITPDEPGLISARIISMIINEAFFAKGENISTESEIDIAMKLGTNYPMGPFEWAKEIGPKNIFELLGCLSKTDSRYKPAELLELKAKEL